MRLAHLDVGLLSDGEDMRAAARVVELLALARLHHRRVVTLLAEGAPVLLGSLQAAEAQQCALEVGCMASFSAPDDPDLGDKP